MVGKISHHTDGMFYLNSLISSFWLSPSQTATISSPEKMMALCAEMDIPQERGMQAELLSYRPDARFDYDLGFGIKRIKT